MRTLPSDIQPIEATTRRTSADLSVDSGLSIGDVFRMLRMHLRSIVLCALIGVIFSLIYVKTTIPVYEATATLRIDPGRVNSLGLSDLLSNPGAADASDIILTEISLIKSDGTIIRALDSLSGNEFYQYAGFHKLPLGSAPLSEQQENLINRFRAQMVVKQLETTQLVTVSFRDKNPQVAATIVNHLVRAYELQNFDSRDASVAQLRTWLSAQMSNLRLQVETSQKKLAAFQEANNIIGTEGTNNTITDRLSLLNQRLTSAQADRIDREARVQAAASGDPNALAALYPNPKLQSLQAEQGTLYTQYAQLSAKFGPSYPPLIALIKQIVAVNVGITADVQAVKNRLQQEYETARNAQDMLQKQYSAQTQAAYAFNRNQAEYAVLQAEVTSSRALFDTLQRKLQQAQVDAEVSGLNTMLIDAARAPLHPIEPKVGLVVASCLILGLLAGVASAIIIEGTSDKLQNTHQISRASGYRTLAIIPSFAGEMIGLDGGTQKSADRSNLALVTLKQPGSINAEAYRTLRNALLLSFPDHPNKTLLVASGLPGEGSAVVAANCAVTLSKAGVRVLLVDADLRCPSLHRVFGVGNELGLSECLLGGFTQEAFVQPLATIETLCLLTAGQKHSLPSESLASDNFHNLLTKWSKEFDYTVIHSAPLLVVSDGLPLASWVDGTLLVTRYNRTSLHGLAQMQELFNVSNAHVVGVILNDTPNTGRKLSRKVQYGDCYDS